MVNQIIFDASWQKKRGKICSFLLFLSLLFLIDAFLPNLVHGHFPVLIHLIPPQLQKRTYNLGEPVSINLLVQNVSPIGFTTPICVRELVSDRSYHLGCVPEVPFSSFNGGSQFSFNVTRTAFLPGFHLVIFSYQDIYGRWHEILDSGHHLLRASYWVN